MNISQQQRTGANQTKNGSKRPRSSGRTDYKSFLQPRSVTNMPQQTLFFMEAMGRIKQQDDSN